MVKAEMLSQVTSYQLHNPRRNCTHVDSGKDLEVASLVLRIRPDHPESHWCQTRKVAFSMDTLEAELKAHQSTPFFANPNDPKHLVFWFLRMRLEWLDDLIRFGFASNRRFNSTFERIRSLYVLSRARERMERAQISPASLAGASLDRWEFKLLSNKWLKLREKPFTVSRGEC